MPLIELKHVSVDFPVFTSRSRGLVNMLFMYTKQEQKRVEKAGMFGYKVHALRDVSLSVKPGERIGIIGRNGAGKTTLLRVMSGVYEPSVGSIRLEGRISSLTDIMLGMDMDASGYENIVLRAIVLGLTRKQAVALIPEVAEFSELGQYLDLPVSTYSSGMMLRLAFAVSTAVIPDILLMDEMIGAGDSHFVTKAQDRLGKMIERVSILIIASHNEDIIRSFCSKAIYMEDGMIRLIGSVDECLALHKASRASPF